MSRKPKKKLLERGRSNSVSNTVPESQEMTLKKVHVIFAWEVMATLELFQWESEGREGEGGKWREKIGKTVPL